MTTNWITDREIRTVPLGRRAGELADTADRRAGDFGATKELCAGLDYGCSQGWAAAFASAGFGGILHELRHDPRAIVSGISLFGPAGFDPKPPAGDGKPLTADDVQRAGVAVFDPPSLAQVRIVDS